MRMRLCGVEVYFSFWFFAVLAVFLLVDGGEMALYFLLPVCLHEAGHLLVMAILGVRVRHVRFCPFGVDIGRQAVHELSYGQEIAISLSGAAANLLAALCLRYFCFQSMRIMLLVAANVAVAVFNLLPIGNLDGGQAVRLLAERMSGVHTAHTVSKVASFVALTALFASAALLFLSGSRNITLPVVCLYLAVAVIRDL